MARPAAQRQPGRVGMPAPCSTRPSTWLTALAEAGPLPAEKRRRPGPERNVAGNGWTSIIQTCCTWVAVVERSEPTVGMFRGLAALDPGHPFSLPTNGGHLVHRT